MWGGRRQIRNTSSVRAFAVLFTLALLPGGCFGETFQRGYVLPDGALEQIPLGASQEQVLLVLGTPSTVATVSGEAFYYISQKAQRPISFVEHRDHRPARDRGLFRQEPKSSAARRIRHERRQGVRLHQPHDADHRRREQHHHLPVQDHQRPRLLRTKARKPSRPRAIARGPADDANAGVSAPARRAAATPRCW